MRKPLTVACITDGLGYCCEWRFWRLFAKKSDDIIATRLGVSAETVHKRRRGSCACEGLTNCQWKEKRNG